MAHASHGVTRCITRFAFEEAAFLRIERWHFKDS